VAGLCANDFERRMQKMNLTIDFNLFDSIEEQLKNQGFTDAEIDTHEKIRQNIFFLYIYGYISEGQRDKMLKKLFKEIAKNITKI
jgi:hypothetical protein